MMYTYTSLLLQQPACSLAVDHTYLQVDKYHKQMVPDVVQ